MNESIKVTGKIKWEKFTNGVLVQSGERDNIITTIGKNGLASLLNSVNSGNTWNTYMGFGSGTTPVAVGDVALTTELVGNGYVRASVTNSNPSPNVIQYVANLTGLTSPVTVQEVGLFDNISAGNLNAHQLTGTVDMSTSADSLQITWQVAFN